MVEGNKLSNKEMEKNISEYDKMLEDFEGQFMGIKNEIDYSKLMTKKELAEEEENKEEGHREARRQSQMITFDVTDKFGFVK